jgi:hypothetical protein
MILSKPTGLYRACLASHVTRVTDVDGPCGNNDRAARWVRLCAREPRLVRCHLHLLAGRAEDRLSLSLQPGVACRLGLDAPHKSTAPLLLDLFRCHRRNVLAAVGVVPRSRLRLPSPRYCQSLPAQLVATDCSSVRTSM